MIINFLELPHFYKSELLKKKKTISNHPNKKKKKKEAKTRKILHNFENQT